MGCVRCDRCGRIIDLDWHVEDYLFKIDYEFLDCEEFGGICTNCLTEEEEIKVEELIEKRGY